MKKKLIIPCTVVFLNLCILSVSADINPRFEMSAGAKGFLSSFDESIYAYYKPYLNLGCATDYFGIFAGYARYFNYQIIDGSYNNRYIGMNQIKADIEITPVNNLLVGFEFYYFIGESDYIRNQYVCEAGYDFKKVSLFSEFSYDTVQYTFNRSKINSMSWDIYAEIAYYFTDNTSIDLSYDHLYYYSRELKYETHKNMVRIGFLQAFLENMISIMSGIGMGWDSEGYFLLNMDAGINVYPWEYIKISAFYIFSYNSYLQYSSGPTNDTHIGDDGTLYNNSFMSHKLVFGISFEY